jgi:recombination protein RecR
VKYPLPLSKLIGWLQKLPGVGFKTAERFAFDLLSWPSTELAALHTALAEIQQIIEPCPVCGSLKEKQTLQKCFGCDAEGRDGRLLCVVASPRDVYALEETRSFRGLYHVLGSLVSPLEETIPPPEAIDTLLLRLTLSPVAEVILAFDSTLEGDATALYVHDFLKQRPLKVSRIAFGIPLGSHFQFVDGGTLARALLGRHHM